MNNKKKLNNYKNSYKNYRDKNLYLMNKIILVNLFV